ncbi:MAG: tripartite tricarboxylate transporter substrate binding protein [Phreatobacter sp.]|uniref:Bug family tripartite tricarboxylate transporter substrate binding protein n=1 Tax=Phreatobacter sp. TaxID=1966341 RepID=UPI001A496F5E|nr:tripartite tricarboxylate transporter substrate-binding protein [Phreatobacter sp.]MBL8568335.1 tripartite tricarboxylate transporter substrate binding protein [Phreatobacter sp.]
MSFVIRRRTLMAGLVAGLAAPSLARAQSQFEGKTVRLIVPFPAGGGTDVAARLLAERLGPALKARLVVENLPGGGGSIGYRAAVAAPNDGTAILLTSSAIATMPFLYPARNYDPQKELIAVSMIGQGPSLICVGPHVPVRTLKELIDLAKSKPGELSYASAGIGSGLHLSSEVFIKMAGINIKHVPYRGAALATSDILGGRIDMIVDILTSVRPLVGDGKLRALAITSKGRSPLAPEYVPAAETVPGYDFAAWFGVYLPAGAQRALADELQAAIATTLTDVALKERYAVLGMETAGTTPAAFRAFMASELDRWGRVIKDLGITAEGG